MSKKKSPFDGLTKAEGIRAFLEQWGIWPVMVAGLITAWSYLESQLPYWGIALVLIFTLAVTFIAFEYFGRFLGRRKERHTIPIERQRVADELQELSTGIAELSIELNERSSIDFWQGAKNRGTEVFVSKTKTDSAVLQKFASKYYSRVIKALTDASKLCNENYLFEADIDKGIYGAYLLTSLPPVLSKISSDVLHGKDKSLKAKRVDSDGFQTIEQESRAKLPTR